jgi:hypothetical protein
MYWDAAGGMAGKSVRPTAGDGTGVSRESAASAVNGPALLPTDDRVGVELQADGNDDSGGDVGLARILRRQVRATVIPKIRTS